MAYGGTYEVIPEKNDDLLNGVTTYDLVLIQKHILGIDQFSSPYKVIAADIDHNNKLTAIDLVELRENNPWCKFFFP